jgi:hypothetical protein
VSTNSLLRSNTHGKLPVKQVVNRQRPFVMTKVTSTRNSEV